MCVCMKVCVCVSARVRVDTLAHIAHTDVAASLNLTALVERLQHLPRGGMSASYIQSAHYIVTTDVDSAYSYSLLHVIYA